MPRPKVLIVNKIFTDKEISLKEGTWFDESHIKYPIVNSNTDIYWLDDQKLRN